MTERDGTVSQIKKIVCPKCKAKLKFDPDKITSEVVKFKCPGCKTVLRLRRSSLAQEPDLTREESDFIRDMELCQKYMIRVRKSLSHKKKGSKAFEKTVKLLIDGMSEIIEVFRKEISENIRETIRTLYESGKTKRGIARFLNIDIKTVRKIISSESDCPKIRKDKKIIPEERLKELYQMCEGYVQRMYEIVTEEDGLEIGYSTLMGAESLCQPAAFKICLDSKGLI